MWEVVGGILYFSPSLQQIGIKVEALRYRDESRHKALFQDPQGRENKVKVKVTQSCPTLCDPMNYTVLGILQARILEWVVFPFSGGSSLPRN